MLKGAIFDFDGTLFDSMFIWNTAGENYLRSMGKEPQEDLKTTLECMSLQESAKYLQEKYAKELSIAEILDGINKTVENFYFHKILPKTGVSDFLQQMKNCGIRMCIATATEKYQTEAALKRCGLDGFFEKIFTCTEVGHGKNEPYIYRRAMEYLNFKKSEIAVFEDSPHAAKTAETDGFFTVAVYDIYEKNPQELRKNSDFFIENFAEKDIFKKFLAAANHENERRKP